MKIKLDGNYIITSDSRQYILSKWKMVKNKKSNEDELQIYASTFHSTIVHTLQFYKELVLRSSDIDTIDKLMVEVERLDEYIRSMLKDN